MEIPIPKLRDISHKLNDIVLAGDTIIFKYKMYPASDWIFFKGNWYNYFKFDDNIGYIYKRCDLIAVVEG